MFANEWLVFGQSDAIVHYAGWGAGRRITRLFFRRIWPMPSTAPPQTTARIWWNQSRQAFCLGVWPSIRLRSPIWMPSVGDRGIRQVSRTTRYRQDRTPGRHRVHYVGRVTVFRGRRPDCALVLCGANRAGQGMIAGERGVTEAASVGIDLARLR